MPDPIAAAAGTLPDLRHASVDDPPGARRPRGGAASAAAIVALAATLAGCARDAAPATFAPPAIAVAPIRMACPAAPPADGRAPDCPPPLPRSGRP